MATYLLAFVTICFSFAVSSCAQNGDCTYLKSVTGDTQCRQLQNTFTKTKIGGASCAGAALSKKLSITCTPAQSNLCTSISIGAPYYVLLLPNDGTNNFTESSSGKVYNNCGSIWSDLNLGTTLANVTAAYFGDPTAGDALTCTDATGCAITASPNCFSGWDSSVAPNKPSGKAISLPVGTSLLACIYIDSYQSTFLYGSAPSAGLPANSAYGNAFQQITIAAPVGFTSWTSF